MRAAHDSVNAGSAFAAFLFKYASTDAKSNLETASATRA